MGMLSDTKVRGAKGTGKAYKLSDGEELYLHVSAVGGRVWRMNYQFGRNAQGKPAQKTLTIGPYPAISLKDAGRPRSGQVDAGQGDRAQAWGSVRTGRGP
jgi:hypothetical protein